MIRRFVLNMLRAIDDRLDGRFPRIERGLMAIAGWIRR